MTKTRRLLVTNALPYANGPLHLGHMIEHIQTNIWIRFQRLVGHEVVSLCGEDAHGTPIMLKAEQLGLSPEALIAKIKTEHERDFADFHIDYDNYHTTHSPENIEMSTLIYQRLFARGDIATRTILQAYDPEKEMFLPDRYVKGNCPRCNTPDQYGDNCEACGETYSPSELKNPVSVVSGATPIQKESVHYFFELPHYQEILKTWIHSEHLQAPVTNKLSEWFNNGLKDWDISRDAPYFGISIPDAPGKYFYVWLDAPIGYIASFKNLMARRPDLNFEDYWGANSTVELHQFVGKDVMYFHGLFWPAMLHGAGFRMPTALHTHGFLTVNGLKMSKSRGTFIEARRYLDHLDAEYLRYYFAAKLSHRIDDIDLNFEDFIQRVNSDLIGKVVNIASRCAKFINQSFENQLSYLHDKALYQEFVNAGEAINAHYDSGDYHYAVREIMALADRANQYIDEYKPWALAKDVDQLPLVQAICTEGLNLFRLIMLYLSPILPVTSRKVEVFLNTSLSVWDETAPLINHRIAAFSPLLQRIDPASIAALLQPRA
jgi:methionyl-tRNA synthetase